MDKNRSIKILEHQISKLDKKIASFEKFHIDEKKTESLRMMKLKCETELEELLAS